MSRLGCHFQGSKRNLPCKFTLHVSHLHHMTKNAGPDGHEDFVVVVATAAMAATITITLASVMAPADAIIVATIAIIVTTTILHTAFTAATRVSITAIAKIVAGQAHEDYYTKPREVRVPVRKEIFVLKLAPILPTTISAKGLRLSCSHVPTIPRTQYYRVPWSEHSCKCWLETTRYMLLHISSAHNTRWKRFRQIIHVLQYSVNRQ